MQCNTMEVTVESVTGRRTTLNNLDPSETVRNVKTRLWKQEGVPVAQQSLVYRSQALDDERTLNDYQLRDGAVIKLILITRAGPINKRVEFQPKKHNAVNGSDTSNMPATSFGDGSRQPLDSASTSSSAAIRRYTRQQMRQAQLATNQCMGKGNLTNNLRGDPLSSDLEQQSSSSLLDLTFTPERQLASARRADENLRTMQRMRELRRSIERLNLEKGLQKQQALQRNSGQGANGNAVPEGGQSRSRRPTGGSGFAAGQGNGPPSFSTGTQKSRSSTQILVCSNDRHSAAAAAARAAYAADDTSAKESSAGETEMEDTACYRQLAPSNSASSSSNKQSSLNVPVSTKAKTQTSAQQLMPPLGFKSKQQLYRNIRRSSCSDVDVESSAVWSSDADADGVFRHDHSREELYTADDWSLDEEDWNLVSGRPGGPQKAQIIIESSDDYEDANGDDERRPDDAQMDEQNLSSAEDDTATAADGLAVGGVLARNGIQDGSSDPSELSSGVLVCELSMALNNRRMKVKRKSYHTPRHTNKRPQAVGIGTTSRGAGGGTIDETDDQSPLESPVKFGNIADAGRLFPSRFYHHHVAACRDYHHLHAGYFPGSVGFSGGGPGGRNWHRGRPRSKQRLLSGSAAAVTAMEQQTMANLASSNGQQANNSTTTGESSSDEREDPTRRDSQGNIPSAAPPPVLTIAGRSTSYGHKPPQSSQSQQRCNACACRLSVATTFQCRCGKTVCLRHRHADLHGCTLLAAAAVSEKK